MQSRSQYLNCIKFCRCLLKAFRFQNSRYVQGINRNEYDILNRTLKQLDSNSFLEAKHRKMTSKDQNSEA